jgi:hypothetical protein
MVISHVAGDVREELRWHLLGLIELALMAVTITRNSNIVETCVSSGGQNS